MKTLLTKIEQEVEDEIRLRIYSEELNKSNTYLNDNLLVRTPHTPLNPVIQRFYQRWGYDWKEKYGNSRNS